MNFAEKLEDVIIKTVHDTLSKGTLPEVEDYVSSDNLGEVIEKLIILNIRTWMLEDAAQAAKTDEELADIKRKVDICFKQKRPKYVQVINKMIDDAIIKGKTLTEDSVKLYKGVS